MLLRPDNASDAAACQLEDDIMFANLTSRQSFCALFLTCLVALVCHEACAAISSSGSTSPDPKVNGASPVIGVGDVGRLTITGGDTLTSINAVLGDLPAGVGLVTVTDFNTTTSQASLWATTTLMVGDEGAGRLDILNGAVVTVDYPTTLGYVGAGDLAIGNAANGVGTLIVNGLGSVLKMADDTNVGVNGTGTLRIANEGFVNATNDLLAPSDADTFTVGAFGRVELATGGRLRSHTITNNGTVIGSGRVDSVITLANSATGHIAVGAGDRLVVNSTVTTQGEIAVDGGQIEFLKAVTSSNASADVNVRNGGRVTFPTTGFGYDSTAGTLASFAGVNDVYGTVRLQGATSKVNIAGNSTLIFHDAVTNTGGAIDVFPGSTAIYLGGLTTTGNGSVLSIHLTDPDADLDYGQVEVNGTAQLSGNLAIKLASGFVPGPGDAFQILSA